MSPIGGVIPVNSTLQGQQSTNSTGQAGAVAMDAQGNFVITWTSSGQNGNDIGVYAQRYNSAGIAQGSEILVTSTTTGSPSNSTIAMNDAGDFVISWTGPDVDGNGVYARRFNAAGVAQGNEFLVNTSTSLTQSKSTVAMDSTGDFVVTWTSLVGAVRVGVFARQYNAAGVAQGNEFEVNTNTSTNKANATIAMDDSGDFVVTWTSFGQDNGGSQGVYARRYNSAAVAQGDEFLVNTTTAGSQFNSTVAMDKLGAFVVTWTSSGQIDDPSGFGVYARRFDNTGVAQGDEFLVNTNTVNNQRFSAVTMEASGNFIITWTGIDNFNDGILAQRYNSAGIPQGGEFVVATEGLLQTFSSVAMNASGNFVVAWTDNSPHDVFAQLYGSSISTVALTTPGNIAYTENDPATAIDDGLTIVNGAGATLASATVTITNFVAGQDVLSFTNDNTTMGTIAGSFNSGTGVLTLSTSGASATTGQWQSALRAIKYFNSSDNPTTTSRLVQFVVNDGTSDSDPLTSTVAISAVNDAPVIGAFGSVATYTANTSAVVLAPNATTADADTARFNGGVLTISLTSNAEAADRLELRQVTRLISVSGSNVLYRGTIVGTFTGGTGATNLVITFNANATESAVQTVLRNITYRSVSSSPSTLPRIAQVVLTDGAGGSSNLSTKTINVAAPGATPQSVVAGAPVEQTAITGLPVPQIILGVPLNIDGNGTSSDALSAGLLRDASKARLGQALFESALNADHPTAESRPEVSASRTLNTQSQCPLDAIWQSHGWSSSKLHTWIDDRLHSLSQELHLDHVFDDLFTRIDKWL